MKGRAALVLCLLAVACGREESAYLGVTASQWNALAQSENDDLRQAGLLGLIHLAAEDPAVIEHLTTMLQSSEADTGEGIVQSLAALGEPALPYIDHVLSEGSPEAQARAWQVLYVMGERAVPYLVETLTEGKDVPRQVAALGVLSNLGARAVAAVPALISALQGTDSRVAGQAMLVLGRMGQPAQPAIPYLLVAFKHPEPWGRENAVEALAHLSRTVPDVRALLEETLSDPDEELAAGAEDALEMAETLGHEGDDADPADDDAGP